MYYPAIYVSLKCKRPNQQHKKCTLIVKSRCSVYFWIIHLVPLAPPPLSLRVIRHTIAIGGRLQYPWVTLFRLRFTPYHDIAGMGGPQHTPGWTWQLLGFMKKTSRAKESPRHKSFPACAVFNICDFSFAKKLPLDIVMRGVCTLRPILLTKFDLCIHWTGVCTFWPCTSVLLILVVFYWFYLCLLFVTIAMISNVTIYSIHAMPVDIRTHKCNHCMLDIKTAFFWVVTANKAPWLDARCTQTYIEQYDAGRHVHFMSDICVRNCLCVVLPLN